MGSKAKPSEAPRESKTDRQGKPKKGKVEALSRLSPKEPPLRIREPVGVHPMAISTIPSYPEIVKLHHRHPAFFLLPLIASVALVGCVEPGYSSGRSFSGGGLGIYAALPANYVGHSYYYDGRYYSGGRYESGHYQQRGRTYANRYYHNGQYLYGGNYQQHGSTRSRQDRHRATNRYQDRNQDHHRSGH